MQYLVSREGHPTPSSDARFRHSADLNVLGQRYSTGLGDIGPTRLIENAMRSIEFVGLDFFAGLCFLRKAYGAWKAFGYEKYRDCITVQKEMRVRAKHVRWCRVLFYDFDGSHGVFRDFNEDAVKLGRRHGPSLYTTGPRPTATLERQISRS